MKNKAQYNKIRDIKRNFLKPLLNRFQRKVVLENLNQTFFYSSFDRLSTVREILCDCFDGISHRSMSIKTKEHIRYYLVNLVKQINIQKIRERDKSKLENKQCLFTVVPNFATYSYGASHTLGYELVVVGIGSIAIANALVVLMKSPLTLNEVIEIPNLDVAGKGPARGRVVEVDKMATIRDYAYALETYKDYLPDDYKVYQIILSDKNNLLPGEEGYSMDCQQLLPVVTTIAHTVH